MEPKAVYGKLERNCKLINSNRFFYNLQTKTSKTIFTPEMNKKKRNIFMSSAYCRHQQNNKQIKKKSSERK